MLAVCDKVRHHTCKGKPFQQEKFASRSLYSGPKSTYAEACSLCLSPFWPTSHSQDLPSDELFGCLASACPDAPATTHTPPFQIIDLSGLIVPRQNGIAIFDCMDAVSDGAHTSLFVSGKLMMLLLLTLANHDTSICHKLVLPLDSNYLVCAQL